MFTREDFLFKFGLKSGYHHLDIFEPHQRYLGFAWEVNSNPSCFVFTVMPFGLATACYAFTKLMWPLVKYWRGRGLHTVLYLDDGIVAVKGKENADRESRQVQLYLAKACLIANNTKSQWVPVKKTDMADQVAVGQWSPEEAHQSLTWKELGAVRLVLGAS